MKNTESRPIVCLNMIVRNESHVIKRCLESVKDFIDCWVICDTGSTDDTISVIYDTMHGVPGECIERPWVSFGENRTQALNYATDVFEFDYLLFIDADETLTFSVHPRSIPLTEDAYFFRAQYGSMEYARACLVSIKHHWKWVGVLHEYLHSDTAKITSTLEGVVLNIYPEGARSKDPQKFLKDIETLKNGIATEPDNTRYKFYLAQSYRDAGLVREAYEAYKHRASLGGWDQEVWYSKYMAAKLSINLNEPFEVSLLLHLEAIEFRTSRNEAYISLCRLFASKKMWLSAKAYAHLAVLNGKSADTLFVDIEAYLWQPFDELALANYYLGFKTDAEHNWVQALDRCDNQAAKDRILKNLTFV